MARPLWLSIKVVVGALLFTMGVLIAIRSLFFARSERAVLSRALLTIRTPISGNLEQASALEGAIASPAQALFTVTDDRADLSLLSALSERCRTLENEVEALQRAIGALDEIREAYGRAAGVSTRAQQAQLKALLAEAKAVETARLREAQLTAAQLARSQSLEGFGLASREQLEQATVRQENAEAGFQQAKYQRQSLNTLIRAVSTGASIESSSGTNFTYAKQRADDIAVALVGRSQELEVRKGEHAAVKAALEAERRRADLLRRSVVTSSNRMRIWRALSSPGLHVSAGQPLAEALDCSREYISALVYVRHASKIAVDSHAAVELYGDDREYRAVVVSIGPPGQNPVAVAPALPPPPSNVGTSDELVPVLLRLEGAEHLRANCAAGIDAEVTF